jgi:hypothetical protein
MQTPMTRGIVVLYPLAGVAPPAVAQVDQQRAQEFFKEVQALCERDGGRLWGVSVCAPMVIADRQTQTFATSQPAPEGARPRLLGLVNAPVQWGGATWGAYMWDDVVNRTPRERKELFLHELFHGVQPQLGLMAPALATEHLDAADGRYWLRLEWRALARALRESGDERNLAVRDALAFRQARRKLYPASVEDERAQEITEGLAAYTGTVLAAQAAADAIAGAVDLLANAEAGESFVRTFAYISGPAYGLLLDASSPGWTRASCVHTCSHCSSSLQSKSLGTHMTFSSLARRPATTCGLQSYGASRSSSPSSPFSCTAELDGLCHWPSTLELPRISRASPSREFCLGGRQTFARFSMRSISGLSKRDDAERYARLLRDAGMFLVGEERGEGENQYI